MCVGQVIRSCSATDIHCVTVKRHEHYHRAGHQIVNKKTQNNKPCIKQMGSKYDPSISLRGTYTFTLLFYRSVDNEIIDEAAETTTEGTHEETTSYYYLY